jgi:hypothetical protein
MRREAPAFGQASSSDTPDVAGHAVAGDQDRTDAVNRLAAGPIIGVGIPSAIERYQ